MIPAPANDRDALIAALVLAITASSEAKSRKAVRLARSFSSRLSKEDVEKCQRAAAQQVKGLP